MLTNPMLNGNNDGVAFLDLDPGQPESTPPGHVSLFHLQSPLLGPPFSHAGLINDNCLVRSHHIGYSTPEHNPDHYVACALNLFAQYRKLVPHHPACPLVINTAGWVKAVGLEILIDLLRQSFATHLVWFMSESEPLAGREDLASLRRASEGITVHELPLQPTRPTSRTPADLRAMQTLSYLHLSPGLNADSDQDGHGLQWDATPLTHQIPWVVEYSGPTPGILGIVILDEALPIELLATAINGTVVAVVVIEDDDAFPTTDGDQKATGTTSNEKGKQRPRDLTTIDYDPATKLPYIHTPNGAPLDPTKTSCAGLALIRGIDTASQTLHLITPINPSSLPPDKNIVLVRGRTELSVMAYVEGGMEADMPYLSFEKTKHGNPTIRTKPSG
jgi:polynucleotide 5'-hydroxyl-kinase GRC3/NOL9